MELKCEFDNCERIYPSLEDLEKHLVGVHGVHHNPTLFKPLQDIGQSNPEHLQIISQNQDASNAGDQFNEEITGQGNKVRDLKSKKAEKAEVDSAVATLLGLKAKYKAAVGKDWKPGTHQPSHEHDRNSDRGREDNKIKEIFDLILRHTLQKKNNY